MRRSPYVEHTLRLQDVMAAIQVMATHRSDTSTIVDWAERMGRPVSLSGGTWEDVFREHPEFFRLEDWKDPADNQMKTIASLTWRKANEKRFDPEQQLELTVAEARLRDRSSLRRTPLTTDQVGTLLKAAVDLDARASASQERKDKIFATAVTVAATLLTAIVGAILGAALKTT